MYSALLAHYLPVIVVFGYTAVIALIAYLYIRNQK